MKKLKLRYDNIILIILIIYIYYKLFIGLSFIIKVKGYIDSRDIFIIIIRCITIFILSLLIKGGKDE